MLGMSYETAWNMHHRSGQAMEKPEQKAFLRKLIGVIGAPESEVGCGPQKLDSSLMQPPSPASTRGAIHRALPCFGGRALPEGDDDGRSSVAMVGLGSECPDQDWCEL